MKANRLPMRFDCDVVASKLSKSTPYAWVTLAGESFAIPNFVGAHRMSMKGETVRVTISRSPRKRRAK